MVKRIRLQEEHIAYIIAVFLVFGGSLIGIWGVSLWRFELFWGVSNWCILFTLGGL